MGSFPPTLSALVITPLGVAASPVWYAGSPSHLLEQSAFSVLGGTSCSSHFSVQLLVYSHLQEFPRNAGKPPTKAPFTGGAAEEEPVQVIKEEKRGFSSTVRENEKTRCTNSCLLLIKP